MRSKVAEVAKVATPSILKNTNQAANDTGVEVDNAVHFRWLIHFPDREPIEATFSPEANHGAVLACYPGAVAAEPIPDAPSRKPTDTEAAMLRVLIAAVYRDDTADDQNEALQSALADPDNALACYKAISVERGLIPAIAIADDRRNCRQCSDLSYSGACSAASPGGALSAQEGYRPGALWQELPHRCEAFNERGAK